MRPFPNDDVLLFVFHGLEVNSNFSDFPFDRCQVFVFVDVDNTVDVETDLFVCDCAHHVGEAVLVSSIAFSGYRHAARRLLHVLREREVLWVCEPKVDIEMAAPSDLVCDGHLIIRVQVLEKALLLRR